MSEAHENAVQYMTAEQIRELRKELPKWRTAAQRMASELQILAGSDVNPLCIGFRLGKLQDGLLTLCREMDKQICEDEI